MNKLIELERIEREASKAFQMATSTIDVREAYKALEKARKEYWDYRVWLQRGSGVNGNEITY